MVLPVGVADWAENGSFIVELGCYSPKIDIIASPERDRDHKYVPEYFCQIRTLLPLDQDNSKDKAKRREYPLNKDTSALGAKRS